MATESTENVLVESQKGITRLTINRPRVLNALNRQTLEELDRALSLLGPELRVLILTGAGDKAFVAGADIQEMAMLSPLEAATFSRAGHAFASRLEALPVPVIAEVNGFALGGGCELMLACDFAIASENARFGQPEVGLGVTPGFGGTTRLSRRIGAGWARQLVFSGAPIKADAALRLGLVNEVMPATELRARVDQLANKILENAPLAVALAKRSLLHAEDVDLGAANRFEQEIFGMCFSTEDQKEGMRAFIEKRPPIWRGR